MNSLRRVLVLVVLLFVGLLLYPQFASADTTSFRSAATITTDGSPGYTNLGNCSATDGFTCDRASAAGYGNLYFHNFGDFGIPDGSTITNVRIRVTGKASVTPFALFVGLSGGKIFSFNCQFPSDRWTMWVLNSSVINTYTTTASVADLGGCLSFANVKADNYVWRINYSTGSNWSANIDDFEIAFDYTPPAIPTPTPSPTATPTPSPPTPFLDLPWDYENKRNEPGKKSLTFNDAALLINTYFDHEYPFLCCTLYDPPVIRMYLNKETSQGYSSHDGYDYGTPAQVEDGDPVFAAAEGTATVVLEKDSGGGGNVIKIDHGNGYETIYEHLYNDDALIVKSEGEQVHVKAGQQIGRVGHTGDCWVPDSKGNKIYGTPACAHIHFGVVQDKNHDGNFDNNIPDGLTDPYGWQSTDPDPWAEYHFIYDNLEQTGNTSFYLWKQKLNNLDTTLTANGGIFSAGSYRIELPPDQYLESMSLGMQSEPAISIPDGLRALEPLVQIALKDPAGTAVTALTNPFTLIVDFAQADLSLYKTGSISIYSSEDQKTWKKEDTTIDEVNKKASAQINHMSFFAIMGERADTVAPMTTAELSGDQGDSGWYRSDVSVRLDAQDNDGGLGDAHTFYLVNDGDWQRYITPIFFSEERHYKISYYSDDKDKNIEDVKTVEFDIDKTPPLVNIGANPKVLWPPDGKMVDVIVSGNSNDDHLASTNLSVSDEYQIADPLFMHFGQVIQLEARRNGNDLDGRLYTITANATDKAGNKETASTTVIVPHDQEAEQ